MKTDRSILPDDWDERSAEDQAKFWSSDYETYCDALSDDALRVLWNKWREYATMNLFQKHSRYLKEIILEILKEIILEIEARPNCGIKVPDEVVTFLVSKALSGG